MLKPYNDEYFMKMALKEAQYAFDEDEVPIGAVIVCKNQIIARSHNLTERLNDFTAHAEMQAFTSATEYLGGKYLDKCTLYVTLEPCVMCAGAAYHTKIGKIIYGAKDEKRGSSNCNCKKRSLVHPKTEIKSGIMEAECAQLLVDFFAKKRKKK